MPAFHEKYPLTIDSIRLILMDITKIRFATNVILIFTRNGMIKPKYEKKYRISEMKKWNPKIKKYEDFKSPAIVPILFVTDEQLLEKHKGQCTNCGGIEIIGRMYTSRTIHNHIGLGYSVCEKCYYEEWEEEKQAKLLQEKKENETE